MIISYFSEILRPCPVLITYTYLQRILAWRQIRKTDRLVSRIYDPFIVKVNHPVRNLVTFLSPESKREKHQSD